MTLKIPNDLHEAMRRYPEIRWSEVARRAFQMELDRLEIYDRLLANSKLTIDDAIAFGREIREGQSKRIDRKLREIRKA